MFYVSDREGRLGKFLNQICLRGDTQLLRFFLALLKNKIIFRSVPKCQYLSVTLGFITMVGARFSEVFASAIPIL
jgi:hypothetical protein